MSQSSVCYHCHEPIPSSVQLNVTILGQVRPMCCIGCQSVAESIVQAGLSDYYRHRTDSALKVEGDLVPQALKDQFSQLDLMDVQSEFCTTDGEFQEALLSVDGVRCAACAWLIETTLSKQVGVSRARVNAASHRLLLRWRPKDTKLSTLLQSLAKLGYQALPYNQEQEEETSKKQKQGLLIRLGVSALASMQVMMFAVAMYFGVGDMEPLQQLYMRWVSLLMATPVIIYAAYPFYVSAIKSLQAKQLNMDVPVSLALILAYVASAYATLSHSGEVYFESISMFVFFLLVGRYLELLARINAHTRNVNAVKMLPAVAHRLIGAELETVPVKSLLAGQFILLKPGETMPVDGVVHQGHSQIDVAVLTGEYEPQPCQTGDVIYAGSINLDQPLHIEVTEVKETLVASIVRLQEQALAERSNTVALTDQVARYFVLAILLIASATTIFWWNYQPEHAIWVTLAVLVATCPCALSLATPTAMTAGLSRLSDIGLIARRASILTELARINLVALDKTGTLTLGRMQVSQCHLFKGENMEDIIAIAQALEQGSGHPLARAIHKLPCQHIQKATMIQHLPGLGIEGCIESKHYVLGSHPYIRTYFSTEQHLPSHRVLLIQKGNSSASSRLLAGFDFDDPIRADAQPMLDVLQHMKIETVLLSGDQQGHVDTMARSLSIVRAIGDQPPSGKKDWVAQQQDAGRSVLMVGDGINDSPVLAQANASIAIADGTDIAKRSADAVLISQRLSSIPQAIAIAKSTRTIIKQNFAWALGYNLLILPLAVTGLLPPYLAVIGMSASSLVVVVNALRVGRHLRIST